MFTLGVASRDITPDRPAMVQGQKHIRIARKARDPLTITAMAISGNRPDGKPDHAVIVSMDICIIPRNLHKGVLDRTVQLQPEISRDAIILCATHTHESMVLHHGSYPMPKDDIMDPNECRAMVIERISDAIVEAWNNRAPAKIDRGFGHAVVAFNRRPVYADGAVQMYGDPAQKSFRWIEGPEDHTVDFLFVWNAQNQLAGVLIDLPCPSQVDEQIDEWSADFWHEVRVELRSRLGQHLWILPICGAAGDQSPRPIFNKRQEKEWLEKRGISDRQDIAEKICDALYKALKYAKPREQTDVVVAHECRHIEFPHRKITQKERDWHAAQYQYAIKEDDPNLWWPQRLRQVVEIFEGRAEAPPFHGDLHVVRIGDLVFASNPFELFTDFGHQIKSRSPAAQTFLSQVSSATGMYLPTQRGADGGGYGSIPAVSFVGPEGGQMVVENTLEMIHEVFPEKPAKV